MEIEGLQYVDLATTMRRFMPVGTNLSEPDARRAALRQRGGLPKPRRTRDGVDAADAKGAGGHLSTSAPGSAVTRCRTASGRHLRR